jgi:hypothetical protein
MDLAATSVDVQQQASGLNPANVIGGARFVEIEVAAGQPSVGTRFQIDPIERELRFLSDPNAYGYLTLTYGQAIPLNVNLLAGGVDRFVFDVKKMVSVFSQVGFSVNVVSGAPGETPRSAFGTINFFSGQTGRYVLPFADLAQASGFDLTEVRSITLSRLRFPPGSQLVLTSFFTAVPEQAAGILALMAGSWELTHRRRRRGRRG